MAFSATFLSSLFLVACVSCVCNDSYSSMSTSAKVCTGGNIESLRKKQVAEDCFFAINSSEENLGFVAFDMHLKGRMTYAMFELLKVTKI